MIDKEMQVNLEIAVEFREPFFKRFCWILALGFIVVGVVFLPTGSAVVPMLFFNGALLFVNALIYRIRQNYLFSALGLTVIYFVSLAFAFYTTGYERMGIIWLVTFPVLVYFLFGRRYGKAWVILFIGWILAFNYFHKHFYPSSAYNWDQVIQAVLAVALVSVAMHYYDSFSFKQQQEIKKYSQDLEQIAYKEKLEYEEEHQLKETLERQKRQLEDGRIAVMNLLEDVRAEQKASKALARDLQKFKQAVDAVSDQIVITDPEGLVLYANQAVERITGYKPEQALGKKAGSLWSIPQPKEYYQRMWNTIKNEKQPFFDEITNRKRSGQLYTASIKIYPVLDSAQNVEFFVGIEQDVTQQRKSHELEQQLASIIENTDEAIIGQDLNGVVISWNKGAEKVYGYSDNEILGKPVNLIIPQNRHEERLRVFQEVAGKGQTLHLETIRQKKDGTQINVLNTYSAIKDTKNQIVGFSVISRDITKEKQIDQAKTEFVALASHQLKTPLAAVNWYTEMLMHGDAGKLSKDQLKYMKEIYEGSKRMTSLVNSLLNVSRLDMGNFAVEPEPVDVKKLAEAVYEDLEHEVLRKKLAVKLAFPKKISQYSADPNLLRMVFQNLLSNAVKYTGQKGKIKFEVSLQGPGSKFGGQVLPAGGLCLCVSDNGIGIPKSQQPKIFNKMFRADNAKNEIVEGNGLGLYIVKNAVKQVGGQIWFDSKEGSGSAFYVVLPPEGMQKKSGEKKLS